MKTEERDAINKKILEWCGGHWHEWKIDRTVVVCSTCDEPYREMRENPDYVEDADAMLQLIEAVKAKGFGLTMATGNGPYCVVVDGTYFQDFDTLADTLPMAVAQAVNKLIDIG